eukprot:COSAG02_NODE_2659_length_8310_cov_10.600901_3_plen_97_part_00
MEPEPQQDHEGADDISMNEIIRDVADNRITREEEETLSAEELAKKQAKKVSMTRSRASSQSSSAKHKRDEASLVYLCKDAEGFYHLSSAVVTSKFY